jgi:hypothetical protein
MPFPSNNTALADKGEIARLIDVARMCGVPDAYAGKRQESRVTDAMQLEVTTDPNKPSDAWPVSMNDISDSGVSFWSRHDVPLGTVVYVREFAPDNSRLWLPVRVRHRTMGIRGYLIGACFEVSTTSGRSAAPSVPSQPAGPPQTLPPGLRGPRR